MLALAITDFMLSMQIVVVLASLCGLTPQVALLELRRQ
jgi:hypothetical protein